MAHTELEQKNAELNIVLRTLDHLRTLLFDSFRPATGAQRTAALEEVNKRVIDARELSYHILQLESEEQDG